MIRSKREELNRNMCNRPNPLVVILTTSGMGKSLYARLVGSPTNMEVRCKNPAISTFTPFLINGKWKVGNGKSLQSLPLSLGEDRMLNERKRINSILGEGSSRRDILKKPTLQSWYRQYKLGSEVQKPTLQSWHCQYKPGSGV